MTFTIVAPSRLSGEKDSETPPSPNCFGVYGRILVTMHPTDVNFSKLSIVEMDGGTEIDPDSAPYIFPDHKPNTKAGEIDPNNQFFDDIGGQDDFRQDVLH